MTPKFAVFKYQATTKLKTREIEVVISTRCNFTKNQVIGIWIDAAIKLRQITERQWLEEMKNVLCRLWGKIKRSKSAWEKFRHSQHEAKLLNLDSVDYKHLFAFYHPTWALQIPGVDRRLEMPNQFFTQLRTVGVWAFSGKCRKPNKVVFRTSHFQFNLT